MGLRIWLQGRQDLDGGNIRRRWPCGSHAAISACHESRFTHPAGFLAQIGSQFRTDEVIDLIQPASASGFAQSRGRSSSRDSTLIALSNSTASLFQKRAHNQRYTLSPSGHFKDADFSNLLEARSRLYQNRMFV